MEKLSLNLLAGSSWLENFCSKCNKYFFFSEVMNGLMYKENIYMWRVLQYILTTHLLIIFSQEIISMECVYLGVFCIFFFLI